MAQTGYTPILIYSSSTVSQAPSVSNLTNSTLGSELAINITDGKLFYKDNANAVQVIAWKTTPTTAGGTGLTSYTAGDLLYYATGTTLSKLAIGASGYWLGSSGTAPQWNAPAALTKTDDTNVTLTLGGSASTALLNAASLTLGWTGTLAVSRGGTGTGTAFTAGSVIFAGASGVYSQDNSTFFWDSTNKRLGLGTATPSERFSLKNPTGNGTLDISVGTTTADSVRLAGGGSVTNWLELRGYLGVKVFANTTNTVTFNDSGDAKIENGNLVIGTSGKGIDFSATAGTGTSELLDDYEEGTWTAVISDGTNNATMVAATQSYTKVGRLVTLAGYLQTSSLGSVTGNIRITGIPFTPDFHAGATAGVGLNLNITANQSVGLGMDANVGYILLYLWDAAAGSTNMQATEWSSDGFIIFTLSYTTAS